MNKLIPLCVLALVARCAEICFRPYDCTVLFGMDESGTRGRLDEYRHVVLVCVSEDYWEVAASKHSIHHFKAHVVRSYKGDWLESERIKLVHGVDSPVPLQVNARSGRLMFVF